MSEERIVFDCVLDDVEKNELVLLPISDYHIFELTRSGDIHLDVSLLNSWEEWVQYFLHELFR